MSDLLHRHSRIPGKVDDALVTALSPLNFIGLSWWMDASQYSYSDNEALTILADLSGNDHYMSGSAKFRTNQIGTLPGIQFIAASNNEMYVHYDQTDPCTVMVVAKMNAGTNQRIISSQTVNWLLGWWSGTFDNYFTNGCTLQAQTAEDHNIHVFTCTQTGALNTIWRHKTQLASNDNSILAPGEISLGRYYSGEASDAFVYEGFSFDRVLSESEILALQNYMIGKWSVLS